MDREWRAKVRSICCYRRLSVNVLVYTRTQTVRLPFAGVFREATTDFTVDARALTQNGGNHIKTLISNPSGSCTDALITDLGDGTYSVEYTPYEEGERWSRNEKTIRYFMTSKGGLMA